MRLSLRYILVFAVLLNLSPSRTALAGPGGDDGEETSTLAGDIDCTEVTTSDSSASQGTGKVFLKGTFAITQGASVTGIGYAIGANPGYGVVALTKTGTVNGFDQYTWTCTISNLDSGFYLCKAKVRATLPGTTAKEFEANCGTATIY